MLGPWGLRGLALMAALGIFAFASRPLRFGLGVGAILWAGATWGVATPPRSYGSGASSVCSRSSARRVASTCCATPGSTTASRACIPKVGNLAESLGLAARARLDTGLDAEARARYETASQWVVMSRRETDLAGLALDAGWEPVRPERFVGVWTDDFSNLFRALRLDSGSRDEAAPP